MKLTIALLFALLVFTATLSGQGTDFTFQGKLNDGAVPANASYDIEFNLYDAENGGTLLGTQTRLGVPVSNGIFTVNLDFGAANFTRSPRFLQISVKPAGGPNFTVLTPRQRVTSTPHAIKSLSSDTAANANFATSAGNATNAINAAQLGGIAANQYVVTVDPRMTDERNPLPNSGNYVRNTTSPQSTSNFNISGDGTANTFNAATQYNIGGSRVLTASSFFGNIFAGIGAGSAVTSGGSNSFFGNQAGQSNSTGGSNSFFGKSAGNSNTAGGNNSFFGEQSGFGTSTGGNNSFFGQFSGRNNLTGSENAFFGYRAGANNTASGNSFFGSGSGDSVTSGQWNSFFGRSAGAAVTTGFQNSFFGYNAGLVNTATGNSIFGAFAGDANTTGTGNSFFGNAAGTTNVTGSQNSFFGYNAGLANTTGEFNAFFGYATGDSNTTGNRNSHFGSNAGSANTDGVDNAFFGNDAGRSTNAAGSLFEGSANSFFGSKAGEQNSTGRNNVFVGRNAGNTNTTGRHNTIIGSGADVGSSGLEYATAIGADAVVTTNQTVVLGRSSDSVKIPGGLVVDGQVVINHGTTLYQLSLLNIAPGQLCITADHGVVRCVGSFAPLTQAKETESQQKQIQQILLQIAELKKLVCAQNPQAPACLAKEK